MQNKDLRHLDVFLFGRALGCISYELVQDQADPLVHFFIEKYADQNAVQAHRETPHFRTLVPKIAELRQKPSEVSTCTVVE